MEIYERHTGIRKELKVARIHVNNANELGHIGNSKYLVSPFPSSADTESSPLPQLRL